MELPDVRHGQPAPLFLTPARGLCPTGRGCSNGALSQCEVGGRCVSAGGMHRTSPGGSFCPQGRWQNSSCRGILWGLCAELMQNVFPLPFPVIDAVP